MNMSTPVRNTFRPAALLLGALLSVGLARAQTAATTTRTTTADQDQATVKLNDFVVTSDKDNGYRATNSIAATHINTPLKDVPFNLQVITPDFIKDIGAFDVQSALEYVPGVTPGADTGGSIRGFASSWTERNGFEWFDPDDVVNVERVEVIRGPNAVLYGQGQPGGLLNYITKRPVFGQKIQHVDVAIGSFSFNRQSLDYNDSTGPIAYRLLAANYTSHGYGLPMLTHQYEHNNMVMIEPEFSIKFPTNTVLTIDAEYVRYERTKPNGIMTQTVNGSSVPIPLIYNIPVFKSWNGPQFNDENSIRNVMAVVDQKFTDNLSFNGGFDWYDRTDHQYYVVNPAVATGDPANPTATEMRGQYLHKINGNTDASWRGDLLYKFEIGKSRHQVLLGYWQNNFTFRQAREQGMILPAGYTPSTSGAPNPFGPGITYYQNIWNPSTARNSWFNIQDPNPSLNVPADMTWLYNPDFFLKQYSTEKYTYATYQGFYLDDKIITLLGVSRAELVQANDKPNGAVPQAHAVIAQGKQTSPLLGAIYRPIPPLSLYVLTSSSLVLNGGQDGSGAWLPPRKGVSYEGGAKMDFWDGRLSGTASYYEIVFKNRVQFDPNATNVDPTIHGANVLLGEDTSKGVDLDLLANPMAGWQIVFGYSHINNYVSKDINPAIVGRKGNGITPNQWKIWNNYEFREGPLTGFSAGLGLLWFDKTLLSYVGTNQSVEKAYYSADARIGYKGHIGKHTWRVDFNAKNILKVPIAVGFNAANNYEPYYFKTPIQYYSSFAIDY
ncbi:MAG: TonB-dependent receptor [Verrucomicrobia bacterium]|nr:TonB-dependent receptor [Verrucomicrobiota bacterium]